MCVLFAVSTTTCSDLTAHSYTLQLLIIILYTAVVDCGPLTDPTNGMVGIPTTTFGSMATYSCNPGYQMTGLMVRTCTASGWSTGDDPVCTGEGDVLLNWCQVCTPQLSVLSSSPWSMEWSATVQTPPPFSREPWLHTAVMRGLLVEALGPVSLTEHGVDHPSLVHVCILKLTTLWVTNLSIQWLVRTSLYQPMEHLCTVTPPSPELRVPLQPTAVWLGMTSVAH